MPQTLRRKAYGRMIELSQDPGVSDGQEVQVTLRAISTEGGAQGPGESIRQSAGPLPDDSAQDDRILAQIQHARHAARRREGRG